MIDIILVGKALSILLLALISPGPDFVVVLRNSLTFGRKSGIATAIGIAAGCTISFSLVLIGLDFLFKYHIIKLVMSIVCGVYLIYMGISAFKSKAQHTHLECSHKKAKSNWTYFKTGFLTNLLNPKLYTFCTAILSYVEQSHPSRATNITIVIGQAIMALIWFTAICYIFSSSKIQDAYFKREVWINRILGIIFVIIGVKIIIG
ncbi:MAG: LysE family translocator [Burkholderiales bacterium]|nr:LysE family translocator [Burkholderiales bacterium]